MVSQCKCGVAEAPRNIDRITDLRAAAAKCLTRRCFAEDGHAEIERSLGRVAADEVDLEHVGDREEAARKGLEPCQIGARQRTGKERPARTGAHRRHVGKVHGQGLVPERFRVDVREKMRSGDHHVDRHRELASGGGRNQRRIVADTEHSVMCGTAEETIDKLELGGHRSVQTDSTGARRNAPKVSRRPAPRRLRPPASRQPICRARR